MKESKHQLEQQQDELRHQQRILEEQAVELKKVNRYGDNREGNLTAEHLCATLRQREYRG